MILNRKFWSYRSFDWEERNTSEWIFKNRINSLVSLELNFHLIHLGASKLFSRKSFFKGKHLTKWVLLMPNDIISKFFRNFLEIKFETHKSGFFSSVSICRIFHRIGPNNSSFETAHRRGIVTGLCRCIRCCHPDFCLRPDFLSRILKPLCSLLNFLFSYHRNNRGWNYFQQYCSEAHLLVAEQITQVGLSVRFGPEPRKWIEYVRRTLSNRDYQFF